MNAIVYSAFGIYAAKGLFFLSQETPMDYVATGMLLVISLLASIIYWKSFNMNLVVLVDRVKIITFGAS